MIKETKNYEGSYTVWNTITNVCVDIERINEYSLIGKTPVRYRVDKGGRTVGTMLPLPEAKKLARQYVK